MKTYLEAYHERYLRNENNILKLCKEVLEKDPEIKVYAYFKNNRIISSVVFIKNETKNHIGFHEVPYRWSGCGYSEIGGLPHYGLRGNEMPFELNDVLDNFISITSVKHSCDSYHKSVKGFLKWCSYLDELNMETINQKIKSYVSQS